MRYNSSYYNASNFRKKFEYLLDIRYKDLPKHKRRGSFEKDYLDRFQENEEKNNIGSSVRQWFAETQKPSIEKLMNICEMLHCDIDYFLTEQTEFEKNLSHASEVTGLEYSTIELLEKCKNITNPNEVFKDYYGKCILFTIDFLLQHDRGRQLLTNLFYYWFKQYSFSTTDDDVSNAITLEDSSHIDDRNISLWVSDISESVFYSWIIGSIARIKDKEQTLNIDSSSCDFVPSKEDIEASIGLIQNRIKEYEEGDYKKRLPYTPEYALKMLHFEDTNQWGDYSSLAEQVKKRVRCDIYVEDQIIKLRQREESLKSKLATLYPSNSPEKKKNNMS